MEIGGSIVVFVIAWWIAFQALLPIGVRSPSEEGVILAGDPGAPTRPRLLMKGLWAALIAAIVWAVLFSIVRWSGLTFADLPSP
jgi:predicted secreted protein